MIRLFDVRNGKVIPTEHCYTIEVLKNIMEEYAEDKQFLKAYAYIFYMTCPNPDLNPYFDTKEEDREEVILKQLPITFSLEDDLIVEGLKYCKLLYETPTVRAHRGIKVMLDNLGEYMESTTIQHGRDGNINSLVNAAAKFQSIRESYKGTLKDLKDEQSTHVRGDQKLGYDQ